MLWIGYVFDVAQSKFDLFTTILIDVLAVLYYHILTTFESLGMLASRNRSAYAGQALR